MNKTGHKTLDRLCLARKIVILKLLKFFTKFVSGIPTVFALQRKFCLCCIVENKSEEKVLIQEKSLISPYCQMHKPAICTKSCCDNLLHQCF